MATPRGVTQFGTLVGNSPPMRRLYRLIRKAAKIDMPVLITGETGTGKDLVASEIHRRSQRAEAPFVALNLGTLSKELMISELFGHKRGAFTGAGEPKAGRFSEAHTGTLFLDEISTADEQVQVALLRVLDTASFRPIGAKKDKHVDVRIIAASNEELSEAVAQGTFRADLLHRFEVLHLRIPPLRKRMNDLPALAFHFLEQVKREFHFDLEGITDETLAALARYPWPGNVRELKNVIAHAAVVAEHGLIRSNHLPVRVLRHDADQQAEGHGAAILPATTPHAAPSLPSQQAYAKSEICLPLGMTLEEVQRAYVLETLSACANNKTQAARRLGISRKTLYDRLARCKSV